MRHATTVLAAVFSIFLSGTGLRAAPTTASRAEMVVKGWLKLTPLPLGVGLSQNVLKVETFQDDRGSPVGFVVCLHPAGFVVVSADDLVEPIIAFTDEGVHAFSQDSLIRTLVMQDVLARVHSARIESAGLRALAQTAGDSNRGKWKRLEAAAAETQAEISIAGRSYLSDIRVAPFIRSRWGQSSICSGTQYCFNYDTPEHHPCGCVATAMAQLMYYHAYPPDRYAWQEMVLAPNCNTTDLQCKAIGRLCYDAGVAAKTQYGPNASTSDVDNATTALRDSFGYANAVIGWNWTANLGEGLVDMLNPNLDAGYPVILQIAGTSGHAVLADGYGYDLGIPYHHLNLGPENSHTTFNIWYNLDHDPPLIDPGQNILYDTIEQCSYNIFPQGHGEILSGRVTDIYGNPISAVTVSAVLHELPTRIWSAETNENGIYALVGIDPRSTYLVRAEKSGHHFPERIEIVGESEDHQAVSGNRWGIDFRDTSVIAGTSIQIGLESLQWDYPLHTEHHFSRTQVIYLANEIGRSGTITGLAIDVGTVPLHQPNRWTIRMKHTDVDEYRSCVLDTSGWTVVYNNNEFMDNTGWHWFEFQTPFAYTGSDNLLVDFGVATEGTTASGKCIASRPGGRRSICGGSDEGEESSPWLNPVLSDLLCSDYIPNVTLRVMGLEQSQLTAQDGHLGDLFGISVGISGDYIIVGADYDDVPESQCGSAYIFKRNGHLWTEQSKLTASDGCSLAYFGYSVSINGDYAIVGAPGSGYNREGRAYVFHREEDDWIEQPLISTLSPKSDDVQIPTTDGRFGFSVSISGDYAVVGAPDDNDDKGSARVFKRSGNTWIQEHPDLTAHDGAPGDFFGNKVSISGDHVIVGAPWCNDQEGSAYIFTRRGEMWIQEQPSLTASDATSGHGFGFSVSIDSENAVVGAFRHTEGRGSAYLFRYNGERWTQEGKLLLSEIQDETPGDTYTTVAICGDRAIIGALCDTIGGERSGAAHVFARHGDAWIQECKLAPLRGTPGSRFGTSVSIGTGHAVVGAPHDGPGHAYVFTLE